MTYNTTRPQVGFLIRNADKACKDRMSFYARRQGITNSDMLSGLVLLYEQLSMMALDDDSLSQEAAKSILESAHLDAIASA